MLHILLYKNKQLNQYKKVPKEQLNAIKLIQHFHLLNNKSNNNQRKQNQHLQHNQSNKKTKRRKLIQHPQLLNIEYNNTQLNLHLDTQNKKEKNIKWIQNN